VGRTLVVAEARDELEAGIWVDALRQAGVRAGTFERSVGGALGGAVTGAAVYPVMVDGDDFGRARNVIAELGAAERLAPFRERGLERERARRGLLLAAVVVGVIAAVGVVSGLVRG
jgi:hypothetical protein